MKHPPEILGKIASRTVDRVEKAKLAVPFGQIRILVAAKREENQHNKPLPFENALLGLGISFICEVKKASPSKGIIVENFPWLEIAKEYETGGAAAISVLTEPDFFLGSDEYLRDISANVTIPTLRKDFIIDPYQIYEAKVLGARAVLLICALLEKETLFRFLSIADELALDCLVEIHSEAEADEALNAGARIIGINNRDLTTFNVDTALTSRLRKNIPPDIICVAESGIKTAQEVRALKEIGINAVLIGESLIRAKDKMQFLKELASA
ncbi:MAG: indole-3-glycerol phosphate synthase TrpC [Treponema sp.]|nr:indole-3-glycerol phosphate synthase TrpC [Treponema sp.]